MVDGTLLCWDAATVFKLHEVTKYRTVAKVNSALTTFMMNLDSLNSLPPEIQKFINESTGYEMSRSVGIRFDEVDQEQLNNVIIPHDKEKGNPELYNLPEDEAAKWREAVKPVYDKWIEEREAKGLPAREFFNDMLEIAAKYNN